MKVPIWIKQPFLQILIYVFFYEILLYLIKNFELFKISLNIGITAQYMFYSFVIFNFILAFLLFLIKKNTTNRLNF